MTLSQHRRTPTAGPLRELAVHGHLRHLRQAVDRPKDTPTRSVAMYTRSANPSGMGRHMLDLIETFAPRADITLACRDTPRSRWLGRSAEQLGAAVVTLPSPHDPAFPHLLRQLLDSRRFDVFHSHAGWGWEDRWALPLARAAQVPAVVLTHHLPFQLSHPLKAAWQRARTAHAHALIAVSDGLRESYLRVGVPHTDFVTVPNGVHPRGVGPGRAQARAALDLGADDLVVMNTGRLTRMKGQRHLIEAAARLQAEFPTLKVVIVGDGDLRAELQRLAEQLGVSGSVVLTGHRSDARMLLDAADVFALPSRSEGMPLALMEAMDAGLPVVATRIVGSADVVADGETGLLVRRDDTEELTAALRRLLGDPSLRRTWGEAGRRRYHEEFTAEQMARRTWAVYDEVLGRSVRAQHEACHGMRERA